MNYLVPSRIYRKWMTKGDLKWFWFPSTVHLFFQAVRTTSFGRTAGRRCFNHLPSLSSFMAADHKTRLGIAIFRSQCQNQNLRLRMPIWSNMSIWCHVQHVQLIPIDAPTAEEDLPNPPRPRRHRWSHVWERAVPATISGWVGSWQPRGLVTRITRIMSYKGWKWWESSVKNLNLHSIQLPSRNLADTFRAKSTPASIWADGVGPYRGADPSGNSWVCSSRQLITNRFQPWETRAQLLGWGDPWTWWIVRLAKNIMD